MYYAQCFNNGNIGINEIAKNFEQQFNINLEHHYRTYIDVARRKINRSKFIANLQKVLDIEFNEKDAK